MDLDLHPAGIEPLRIVGDQLPQSPVFGLAQQVDDKPGHGPSTHSRVLNLTVMAFIRHNPIGVEGEAAVMGWWRFGRKPGEEVDSTIHVRGTRVWLQELQEVCERNFDTPAEAQRQIRQMQLEWTEAHREGDLALELFEGLERRCFRLLMSEGPEWLALLDDIGFWKPGWRPEHEVEDSD